MTTFHRRLESPLGELRLVGEDDTLTGVYFPGQRTRPDTTRLHPRSDTGLDEVVRQLGEYFAGERTMFELPTRAAGDRFALRVWGLIEEIPYGRTATYGDLAQAFGGPSLARAVGAAVGRNPLSVIVPCHRVVGSDGKLTGYAGGLARKRFLLDLEAPSSLAPRLTASPEPLRS